jgi:hypothetical protein
MAETVSQDVVRKLRKARRSPTLFASIRAADEVFGTRDSHPLKMHAFARRTAI